MLFSASLLFLLVVDILTDVVTVGVIVVVADVVVVDGC